MISEVKTDRDSRLPSVVERTAALKSSLPAHGFEYELYTEERIYQEPLFSRARTLIAGLGYRPSDEDISRVRRCLSGNSSGKSAKRIVQELTEQPQFIYHVYAMAIDGYLVIPNDNGPMRFAIPKIEENKHASRI